jgi:hypothetical protein
MGPATGLFWTFETPASFVRPARPVLRRRIAESGGAVRAVGRSLAFGQPRNTRSAVLDQTTQVGWVVEVAGGDQAVTRDGEDAAGAPPRRRWMI